MKQSIPVRRHAIQHSRKLQSLETMVQEAPRDGRAPRIEPKPHASKAGRRRPPSLAVRTALRIHFMPQCVMPQCVDSPSPVINEALHDPPWPRHCAGPRHGRNARPRPSSLLRFGRPLKHRKPAEPTLATLNTLLSIKDLPYEQALWPSMKMRPREQTNASSRAFQRSRAGLSSMHNTWIESCKSSFAVHKYVMWRDAQYS